MVTAAYDEWGTPKRDDRRLFEDLVLDGPQAGLSWMTILRKRENYRLAFDNFDPAKVATYNHAKIKELLQNAGIIRNRQKINSAVKNANAFPKVQEEFGSFDACIWDFVDGKPVQNVWQSVSQLPAKTELSEAISKDLKKRGCSFEGARDRYIPLPQHTLEQLRQCWASHRNPVWLFPSGFHRRSLMATSETHISGNSVWGAFRDALQASGIKKRASVRNCIANRETI